MIQSQFLSYLLETKDANIITRNNINESFFPNYKDTYRYIQAHISTYGNVPDVATVLSKFQDFNFEHVTETEKYLVDELYLDRRTHILADSFNKAKQESERGNIDKATTILREATDLLETTRKRIDVVDLLQDTEERYKAVLDRRDNFKNHYIPTGFKELDDIIGGWDRSEELVTIAARTNQGKSWILLNAAVAALKDGWRVGIYSGEMSENKVGYRVDTLLGHISNSGLIRGSVDLNEYKTFLDELKDKYPGCCKVLTPKTLGGYATVTDLKNFILNEQLDIIFIDQHSLLEDERNGKTPVEKASNISKDLKALQVLLQLPIITVSQQNREKPGEQGAGTENIAQSDRISQDSTIIIFFEQDKDHTFIKLRLVKSRDSVNNKDITYGFDFDKGRFTYLPDKDSGKEACNDVAAEFGYGDDVF